MRKTLLLLTLAGWAGLSALATAPAQGQPAAHKGEQCFASRDWGNWRASPDSKALYLAIGMKDVYRLDLSYSCPELQDPDAHLVNIMRGSDWVCSPLDLDLKVSDGHGMVTPCLVKNITHLSADEASALPRKLRP